MRSFLSILHKYLYILEINFDNGIGNKDTILQYPSLSILLSTKYARNRENTLFNQLLRKHGHRDYATSCTCAIIVRKYLSVSVTCGFLRAAVNGTIVAE